MAFLSDILSRITLAALATTVAVALFLPLAYRYRLLDIPKGRKDHNSPTPVIGGLAMITGFLATAALFGGIENQPLLAFSVSSIILIVLGQLDDKYDLPWYFRICVQIIATLIIAIWGEIRVDHVGALFGEGDIHLGIWSLPLTIFAVVGLINAINMVDGVDGLAGSLALTAMFMLASAALYAGNQTLTLHIVTLCGAVIGFLYFNFRTPWRKRAAIFMGNGGSTFLGFSIAWAALQVTQTPAHPVSPILALWLIPIPLIDCLALIIHRTRKGHSPFKADHNHIHHLMRDIGCPPSHTTLLISLFSLILGLGAAISLRSGVQEATLFLGFIFFALLWCWLTAKRERALTFLRIISSGGKRISRSSTEVSLRRE